MDDLEKRVMNLEEKTRVWFDGYGSAVKVCQDRIKALEDHRENDSHWAVKADSDMSDRVIELLVRVKALEAWQKDGNYEEVMNRLEALEAWRVDRGRKERREVDPDHGS